MHLNDALNWWSSMHIEICTSSGFRSTISKSPFRRTLWIWRDLLTLLVLGIIFLVLHHVPSLSPLSCWHSSFSTSHLLLLLFFFFFFFLFLYFLDLSAVSGRVVSYGQDLIYCIITNFLVIRSWQGCMYSFSALFSKGHRAILEKDKRRIERIWRGASTIKHSSKPVGARFNITGLGAFRFLARRSMYFRKWARMSSLWLAGEFSSRRQYRYRVF